MFAQERARQTLEPLLSTTLTSRELMEQKVKGTNRLLLVLATPIITVYLTHAFMTWRGNVLWTGGYLVIAVLLMFVILRTIVWLSAAIGIRVRSQTKAITASIVVVSLLAVVLMLPSVVVVFLSEATHGTTAGIEHVLSGIGAPGAIANVEEAFLTLPGGRRPFRYGRDNYGNTKGIPVALVLVPSLFVQLFYLIAARWIVLRMTPQLLQRLDSEPNESYVKWHPASV